MVTAKVWKIVNKPSGFPKLEDFKCIEEELPPCKDGEFVVEAEWFSVDPYMRYRIRMCPVNTTVTGSQVSKVIESKNDDFPVGTYVVGYPGWRSHTLVTKENFENPDFVFPYFTKMPDLGSRPKSTALGVLGMPGLTAYFGFLEICQPKSGETVLVNGAAGAVGSCVCQIAKLKGCTVIAFAGSEAKVNWLKEIGIDHVFNYKTDDISESLKKAAPKGINCYFDNVGGEFTAKVLPHMADFGRISICGCISIYNDDSAEIGTVSMISPLSQATLLWKQLRVEGFIVSRWQDRIDEGFAHLKEWVEEGKLIYKETITEGFENMPKAFIGLFHGENIGKAIVKP